MQWRCSRMEGLLAKVRWRGEESRKDKDIYVCIRARPYMNHMYMGFGLQEQVCHCQPG